MKTTIIDYDFKGRPFARYQGKALFLDYGVIGDKIEFSIKEDKKNYTLGKTTKILELSEDRIEAKCPYYKKCGGCDFLEYKYEKQVEWKKEKVVNDIKRIGKLDIEVENTLKSENPYQYRNNIQLKIKDGKIGYFAKDSKTLVEIDKCLIAESQINKAIPILKNWKGLNTCTDIIIRQNYKEELMIILVTKTKVTSINSLLNKLLDLKIVSVYENINNSKFRLGNKFKKIYGQDYLEDKIGEISFKLSPRSFFQVNRKQAEKLYDLALDYLQINKEDIIFDLYCGIGTITLKAAEKAKEVVGIELVEDSIKDAQKNAEKNNIDNVRFIAGKSEEIIEKLIEEGKTPNKIILDPPRAGIDEKLIERLKKLEVEKISYISCNPSTQARDLEKLKEKYKVEKIIPVDMFSQTVHVETVALLSKLDTDEHINIEVNEEDLKDINLKKDATYEDIKKYVLNKHGFKVSNLYIAQVKRKLGIIERENYNKSNKKDQVVPKCPENKEKVIIEALEWFGMI